MVGVRRQEKPSAVLSTLLLYVQLESMSIRACSMDAQSIAFLVMAPTALASQWMHATQGEGKLISKLKPMISMFIHVVGHNELDTRKKPSHSQRVFIARHHDIVPLLRSVDTAWRILSLSINTTTSFTSTHGTGPLYTEHAVITIASMLSRKGQCISVLTRRRCSGLGKNFMVRTDPDLITGRGLTRYEPYLLLRAKYIGVGDFSALGRLKDMETIPISFNRSWKDAPSLSGRLLFDLQKHVQEAVLNKLRRPTTSLTDIAQAKSWKRYTEGYYVGKHVNPELHNELQARGPDTRRRLAVVQLA
ncbi:hypothetical protein C8F04DRAFT_1187904 [Mycena alexandri]|uniref:Uncharacterized protein n=1 Tax=Mycena alexandri TaxID=1745969 RepID=A0AAD6WZJ1_9AGAR|nr:hypothetical protein C8F04DRAFT_1187904 [Mycena alexandri]